MATDLTPAASILNSDSSACQDTSTPKPVGFLAYTNGSTTIKRPTASPPFSSSSPPGMMMSNPVVSYKECMRNHAAAIGGHALDGCCEFMPSPDSNPADPTSLLCAACGCHRNFHRRDPDDPAPLHQKHHSAPPPHPSLNPRTPPSESPLPPTTSTFYSAAPHFHLASLRNNHLPTPSTTSPPPTSNGTCRKPKPISTTSSGGGGARASRKRFRTKFTREQKERMQGFAERMGWKMQKIDKRLVEEFCAEIGVAREVLKVWMHNNKNLFGGRRLEERASTTTLHHNNNNNGQLIATATAAAVPDDDNKNGDRIIHGLFYSTSSSNGGGDTEAATARVKVERVDIPNVARDDDEDDDGDAGSGGSRSNGVDFDHFQVVSANGTSSSSDS